MAEWILAGEPTLDVWEMDIRRFGPQYRSPRYTLTRARARSTRPTTTSAIPGHERQAGPAAADLERLRLARTPTARPSARSPAGSGSTGTSRTPPAATSRCGRAAGRGMHWSPAIGAEHRATREARRAVRRVLVRQARGQRARAPPSCSSACATTTSPARSAAITYTQMLNRRGGIECDFTVTRLAEERFQIVTGTAFGNHDAELDPPPPARRRLGAAGRRHLAVGLLRAVGAAGPRDPGAADPRPARLPLHVDAGAHGRRRAGAGAAGHVRRRGRLGAVLPDRVRRRAVAGAVGGGRAARPGRRRLPGDRLAAAGEGLPGVGRRHHRRTRPRYEAGLGFCVRDDKAFIGSEALPGPSPRGGCAASCSTTRARSRSATSRSRIDGRVCGRVTSGGYGYTVERSIAYAYLPAGARARDARSRSTSSAAGSPARSRASRCSTRGAERVRARYARCRHDCRVRQPRLARRRPRPSPSWIDRVRRGQDAVRRAASGCSAAPPCTSRWPRRSSTRSTSSGRSATTSARRSTRVLRGAGVDTDDIEHVPGGKTFFWRGEYGWDLNDRETLDTQLNVFADFEPKLSEASRAADVAVPGQHPARPPARGARAVRRRRGSWRSTR